jgi:hypothetical protein
MSCVGDMVMRLQVAFPGLAAYAPQFWFWRISRNSGNIMTDLTTNIYKSNFRINHNAPSISLPLEMVVWIGITNYHTIPNFR